MLTYWLRGERGKNMSNEIRKEELFGYLHEYDGNGNEIHCKTPYGYEHHQEFDENGNMINYKLYMSF